MALTDKQQRFVDEYTVDLNATQAAIRAGYSPKTATEQGYQLLSKRPVAEAIAEAQRMRAEQVGVTADRVVRELAHIAFASITDAMDWGDAVAMTDAETGEVRAVQGLALIPAKDLPAHIRGAISEVKQTRDGMALKMHSKPDALDKLSRYLGLYAPDKHELAGRNGGPIEVKERSPVDVAKAILSIIARAQAESAEKAGQEGA